jgi:hypothetical protein
VRKEQLPHTPHCYRNKWEKNCYIHHTAIETSEKRIATYAHTAIETSEKRIATCTTLLYKQVRKELLPHKPHCYRNKWEKNCYIHHTPIETSENTNAKFGHNAIETCVY